MVAKEKNRQIVLLTLFAMTLVVAGHCDITLDYKETWIFKWAYSFHMPLFFFISGFLFCLTNPVEKLLKTSYRQFMKKKTVRLLVPFFFFNTLIFVIKARFISDKSMMQHPLNLDLSSLIDVTFVHPTGFMWFLPTLFVIFLLAFPFWRAVKIKIAGGGNVLIIMMLFVLCLIFASHFLPKIDYMQISKAVYYLTYFLLGILYCEFKPSVDKFIRGYWLILIPVFVFLSVALIFPSGYLSSICGIIFSTGLALILEKKCPDRLIKLSSLCYAVFLLSYFPQMIVRGPIAHRFPDVNQYIFSTISFVMGMFIPLLIGIIYLKIKNKHKLFKPIGYLIGL